METKSIPSVLRSIRDSAEAVVLCLESLKINPDSEELWIAYGELLERLEDLDGAEEAYRSALSINASNARSLNNLGVLLRKRGLLQEAREFFERAIEADKNFPNPRFNLRDIELAEEKIEESGLRAITDRSKASRKALPTPKRSDDVGVWLSTAAELIEYSEIENARDLLEKAAKYFPQELAVWLNYASVLERLCEFEAMERTLRKAAYLHPSSVDVWNWLGARVLAAGRTDEAIDALRKGVQIEPSNSHARLLAILLSKTGKSSEAIRVLVLSLERDGSVASNWNLLGVLLHQSGRHEEAMKSYRAGLEAEPDNSFIYNNIGRLLEEIGDEDGAMEAFDRSVSVDRFNSVAWNNLGVLMRKRGFCQEAEKAFRISVSIAPHYANAWLNLRDLLQAAGVAAPPGASGKAIGKVGKWAQSGWSVFDEQHLSKRLVDLMAQVERSPGDSEQMYELATLMFKVGRYQDSRELVLRAMELSGESARLWNLLGMICEKLGDATKATSSYERAINCDPQCSIALLNLYDLRGIEQYE